MLDQNERIKALDISQSFIVQAPAGSGKTELLIQRYLALLAYAQKSPEEILAITFTRKAATEMRMRIINVLTKSALGTPAKTDYEAAGLQLANQVLARDKLLNWNLLQNTHRLNILTIDSFNQKLVHSIPVLSKLTGNTQPIEDANKNYLRAIRKLFQNIDNELIHSATIQNLLLHLSHDYNKIERLLLAMLRKRDQWLPYIIGKNHHADLRNFLETGLKRIILECLEECYTNTPASLRKEIIELARYAANNLLSDPSAKDSYITFCNQLTELPASELDNYNCWLGISELFLTKTTLEWRSNSAQGITKKLGFPEKNAYKQRMQNLLTQLYNYESWRIHLENLRYLPPANYTEQEWDVLQALLELLPQLAAILTVEFNEQSTADFNELSLSALNALGTDEDPTELALMLDYKIQHILIDEFQDTSPTQVRLLEKLTLGWEANDGRTLFLVGDPMQSIYRFREADVSLFLRARHTGINGIKLQPLTLQSNFRSNAVIIDWINKTFKSLFPQKENISDGAVPYSPSTAIHAVNINSEVNTHLLDEDEIEAEKVVRLIDAALQQDPQQSIAILVRARNHLEEIIPAIKAAGFTFAAEEIEKLVHRPVIQDLFALTKALTDTADRTSWLAILRAPWCGLTLTELHYLINDDKKSCIIDLMKLSENIRIKSILSVLQDKISQRGRLSLRELVESTWLELKGAACLNNAADLENAEMFFTLLEEIDYAGDLLNAAELKRQLEKLYALATPAHAAQISLMTIHKAKGLEFDTVIIPGLHRGTTHDDKDLILWWEKPRQIQASDLILAPINADSHDENKSSIYTYLRRQQKKKANNETARLLYVAVTRARRNLHLISKQKMSAGSFFSLLKPMIAPMLNISTQKTTEEIIEKTPLLLQRVPDKFIEDSNDIEKILASISPPSILNLPAYTSHEKSLTQIIGIITHRCLQKIAEEGIAGWEKNKIQQQQLLWSKQLLAFNLNLAEINEVIPVIEKAVLNTLEDEKGRWILNNHMEANNEYAISTVIDGKIFHFIIDRTFIDQNGIRWIIDYKTGHEPTDKNIAIYKLQLEKYATAMQTIEKRPIRTGLYFPLIKQWYEVELVLGEKNANIK